ncbi:nucleotidyltransferase domain-containing protein [Pontibacter sp. H249]|uniref:nucleotidyltransferase domain-containing protein n=1 Tax=Pontibacter sp. H249 TaxID=3133420 RepID=UPI0030C0D41C
MSTYKNNHLQFVLDTHNINREEEKDLLDKYKTKRDKVKDALCEEYGSDIVKIINSGSYSKFTAINTKFDLDLCVHFKREKFKTLKEMHDTIYEFLKKEYKKTDDDLVKVRKQKVSVGLKFNVDGDDVLFDVTPGRKLASDSNSDENDIKLYLNIEDDPTSKKTNIHKQLEKISGRANERETIKLIKVWKFNHDHDLKSFLVELLTMEAFDQAEDVPRGLWARLKMSLEFIRDNIKTISLKDPGNSNNNVADSLTSERKDELHEEIEEMLEKIEKDEKKIEYYFPANPKYPKEEEKKSGNNSQYERKSDATTKLPPTSYA